jgi:cell division protein FtsB
MTNGLDICETSMMIPFDQEDLWMGTIVSSKPDTTVEQTAHVALTSLCESHLATTAVMPIALFPIRNQENTMWKQHLEVMSNLEGPHFSTGMATMVKYVQYLFNL